MREIRFSIDRDWARAAHGADGFEGALPVTNSWGGWPSAVGVAPYLVLRITASGVPDPVTGYLVNIQELDHLLRVHAIPLAAQRLSAEGVGLTGERLVDGIWKEVRDRAPGRCRLESLTLWTTPYLSYAVVAGETSMVEVTQCFEFSASHRLHVPTMSEEENQRFFGKCNNPRGHGHNYRVEVTVAGPASDRTGRVMPLPEFESVVKREVVDRFDHKHLNADTAEFAELNPSVENLTVTIWRLLDGRLSPARLRRVRVWETAKTYAEYSGE
jgi:6-pyruvoyltetrahydropterin/6-carboxytetrahydropterin synthase